MLIQTNTKKLDKNYRVSATFEHQGCAYEERFNKYSSFLKKMKRTGDTFICAVDYKGLRIIHPGDSLDEPIA